MRSLRSLRENTDPVQYRLTTCIDGLENCSSRLIDEIVDCSDHVIISGHNEGLGPTINRAVAHIDQTNRWFSHPTHGDWSQVSGFICMCQDDLLYTDGWLERLFHEFLRAEANLKNVRFATGLECVEHREQIEKDGQLFKRWIRAAQMFGRRDYWQSLMPIPRFDPETGRVRARPNDGIGSGVDWWMIRNHPNSVSKTDGWCLVIPGLVKHLGYRSSTWLQRELPESESDKSQIEMELHR